MKENLIVCRFCYKSVEKKDLWDHIARDDIAYCPYDCATCGQIFVNKAELMEHETKNGGHKGNYAGKLHDLKEGIIRHIFSESIKVPTIDQEATTACQKISVENETVVKMHQLTNDKKSDENPQKGIGSNKISAEKRRRRPGPNLVLTRYFPQKMRLNEVPRAQQNVVDSVPSTPTSKITLPSISPESKSKCVKPKSFDQSKEKDKNAKFAGSNHPFQGQKRKSRILVYPNGTRVEYENINSDASWETDSNDGIDEPLTGVRNSGGKVSLSLSESANKTSNKTSEKKRTISVANTKNSSSFSIKAHKTTNTVDQRKIYNFKAGEYVKCKRCGVKLKYRKGRSLQNHINTVHLKFPLYKCPHCPATFRQLSTYHAQQHIRTVHGEDFGAKWIDNRKKYWERLTNKKLIHEYFGDGNKGNSAEEKQPIDRHQSL